MMPMKSAIAPASMRSWCAPLLKAYVLMPTMLNVPAAKNVMITPIISPMSPVRVVRNALIAARELTPSSHQ